MLFASGCQQTTTVTNPTTQVKYCENTFVVSGYGYETALYEHKEGGVDFWKLRTYKDDGNDAFFDCKRNLVVSILEGGNAVPLAQEGIVMEDITDNTRSLFHTKEGFNSIVARYKDGFIYSTAKLKGRKVSEQCGFVPQYDLSSDGTYSYVSSYYFDLYRRKNVEEYKLDIWMMGSVQDDELYVGSYYKYNLKTHCSENLFPTKFTDDSNPDDLPSTGIKIIKNGIYYVAGSSLFPPDTYTPKAGQIYWIKDRIGHPIVELPNKDIVYMVIPDDQHLYAFTRARKVYEYDLEQNKTIATYTIATNVSSDYKLGVVGYTRDNFILTFEHDTYGESAIVVTDRNFSNFSQPQIIHDGGLRVSTEQTIATDAFMGVTD